MSKQREESELIIKVAKRVKEIREENGITQEIFYIDTDIHIARIETGKANITINTLSAICKYFDITLSEFFEDF